MQRSAPPTTGMLIGLLITLAAGLGAASKTTLGFGCALFEANLDGLLDLAVANGHIDDAVRNIRGNGG
jgi:hypothetical protein